MKCFLSISCWNCVRDNVDVSKIWIASLRVRGRELWEMNLTARIWMNEWMWFHEEIAMDCVELNGRSTPAWPSFLFFWRLTSLIFHSHGKGKSLLVESSLPLRLYVRMVITGCSLSICFAFLILFITLIELLIC